ncbi:MAG TPA: 2-oxoglutarate dehydrogenase complex dihydrolipoyllysine-residue succinyltransferase [Gammaproteobacteria bacterium]|nr:2-oxoglutarate dehydrogenase complex dihydrolipoyllysine-residue succinyltransferase [Gammaproteobacteria bacterium]
MKIEVKVPTLSESVAEATLLNWHKKPGEAVHRDENLVDIETDKVVLEVVAPADGVLQKILHEDGEVVASDEVIAVIDSEGKASVERARPAIATEAADVSTLANNHEMASSVVVPLSPAARKLMAENNIDPARIHGTGRDNRITKADILEYLDARSGKSGRPQPEQAATPLPNVPVVDGRLEKRVPMSRLRARVAERLKEAQNTAAILTTFNEVNMRPVMDLRNRYKDDFEKKHGTRLGFMSFFTRAVVEALKQFPVINASLDGQDIVYHGYYDIGIAVGSPRGLVVPILRDVEQMGFAGIEATIRDFGQRAQHGKLTLDELTGGTFSITNGGVFGSLLSTPIINPPQSAILGMHKIQQRPVVENGEIVIRPIMYLALSYDHRIIDGKDAVLFLVAIKDALEDPARMLLEL